MPICDLDGARPRPLHGHIWTGKREHVVQTTRMAPPLAPESWLQRETVISLPFLALALLSLDTISCSENIQPLSDSTQFKAFNWGKLDSAALNICMSVCVCMCVLVTQSCPTLCNLMDCSLPDYSVHGILCARILECVAMTFSRGSSQPRDQTWVSCIAGRFFYCLSNLPLNSLIQDLKNHCRRSSVFGDKY